LDGRINLPGRLLDGFGQGGRSARLSWKHRCPQMTLPTTWDDLLPMLSRNFRSQVRRNIKAIATSSDLKTRQLQSSEAKTFTENLIRLNRHRMGNTGRVSSLEDENFRTFLIEAVQYMAEANIAWMDVIEDHDEIVAGSLNFVHGKSIYYYMGGFSENITKLGPGNALFAQVIQRGITNGYEQFDFLRGAESYKYRWGSKDVIDQDLIVYPRGIVRGGIQRATDVSRSFVRRARARLSALKGGQ
jgi:CelD/BcsL family acetyltransferase involved in cellulose biosynthesis